MVGDEQACGICCSATHPAGSLPGDADPCHWHCLHPSAQAGSGMQPGGLLIGGLMLAPVHLPALVHADAHGVLCRWRILGARQVQRLRSTSWPGVEMTR